MDDVRTDADRLLRACLETPGDDTPRLALADYLEEHADEPPCPDCGGRGETFAGGTFWPCDCSAHLSTGRRERAEFIRVQCTLAKLRNTICEKCGKDTSWYKYTPRCRGEICRLRQREYYTSRRFTVWDWCRGIPPGSQPVYARGLVERVSLPLDAFTEEVARRLGSTCPLRAVRLTDREPLDNSGQRRGVQGGYQEDAHYLLQWWGGDPDGKERRHRIPREIMLHLFKTMPKNRRWHRASERTTNCFFETTDAAESALSRACSAYARGAAGFPTRPHATDIP